MICFFFLCIKSHLNKELFTTCLQTDFLELCFNSFSIGNKVCFIYLPCCVFSSNEVAHQAYPSAAAPASLANFRTHCGPPVKTFTQHCFNTSNFKFCVNFRHLAGDKKNSHSCPKALNCDRSSSHPSRLFGAGRQTTAGL